MPRADDELFWERMNSRDEKLDIPGMSNSERLPYSASYDVLVATSAGKPLYHYGHRPRRDGAVRPFEQIVALSAACVAFAHATNGDVRTVTMRQGTTFFGRFFELHVVVSTTEQQAPVELLKTLALAAVTAVYFLASAAFANALVHRPALDLGSRSDSVGRAAAGIVKRALLYPMALSGVVSQPCSHAPNTLRRLGHVLANAQRRRRVVSHVIVFSACPPFPHRVLAAASPVYHKLTASDLFLISALLPLNVKEVPTMPDRVFLQAYSYGRASVLTAGLVQPRLADVNAFMNSVGGEDWRPQWCADGGANSVWVVVVTDASLESIQDCRKIGEIVVAEVEEKIDRTRLAMDLWVWMERPLNGKDIGENIVGVMAKWKGSLVATAGALDYEFALEALKVRRETTESGRRVWCRWSELKRCWVVACEENTYVFLKDVECMEVCVQICEERVLPWLNANRHILFSKNGMVALPPETPLSFLLAPFES